ncbi:MAG: orotidine-5'-phosphate decarboxylase [Patescibacteria group bacterium]
MLKLSERANLTANLTARKLFLLMEEKRTNLCLAADVITKESLLEIAENLGDSICVLKTHIDIIEDFDADLVIQLQRLADKHNFLIFEDRKFADIGNTAKHQYQGGIYHIADWAHLTNAHSVPGPGIIQGLKEIGLPKNRALLLLAEMSSAGALATGEYSASTIQMARENQDFVIGFITTKKLTDEPGFINFTPGVKLTGLGDNLGQQYLTPEKVIIENQSDIIIVGRGIYEAENPKMEAEKYRLAGWQAYLQRTGK